MAMPLDAELARRFGRPRRRGRARAAHRHRDLQDRVAGLGQAVAAPDAKDAPDAVVMFLGANEGFPMRSRGGPSSSAATPLGGRVRSRARLMMNTYRRSGAARVYWLTLPAPRDADRAVIARAVNAAIRAAAAPYRAQVRVWTSTPSSRPDLALPRLDHRRRPRDAGPRRRRHPPQPGRSRDRSRRRRRSTQARLHDRRSVKRTVLVAARAWRGAGRHASRHRRAARRSELRSRGMTRRLRPTIGRCSRP